MAKNISKKRMWSHKGVSRIDQPEKNTFGWYVRIRFKGETKSKFFADRKYGGRDKAFYQARAWYRKESRKILKRIGGRGFKAASSVVAAPLVTVHKDNNTGIVGIQKIVRKKKTTTYRAYRVVYKENGKYKTKFFSIDKYGDKEAFEMARKFRAEKLLEWQ